jgi:DNA-directed RNA polymerase specialized sigma24 family protein
MNGGVGKLPGEYLAFVERILREHPGRVNELERLDNIIEACCRPDSVGAVTPGGAGGVSEQEKLINAKESNPEYQKLFRRVEIVKRAVESLGKEERAVVEMFFWEGVYIKQIAEETHMSKNTVWRMKNRIAKKVGVFVLRDWI